jgi:hypothetical protein
VIKLGVEKGLKTALITPYGTHELVESTTRTNKQVRSYPRSTLFSQKRNTVTRCRRVSTFFTKTCTHANTKASLKSEKMVAQAYMKYRTRTLERLARVHKAQYKVSPLTSLAGKLALFPRLQAWLDYGQDAVVSYLEETLATVTGTTAKHGENLQVSLIEETAAQNETLNVKGGDIGRFGAGNLESAILHPPGLGIIVSRIYLRVRASHSLVCIDTCNLCL